MEGERRVVQFQQADRSERVAAPLGNMRTDGTFSDICLTRLVWPIVI